MLGSSARSSCLTANRSSVLTSRSQWLAAAGASPASPASPRYACASAAPAALCPAVETKRDRLCWRVSGASALSPRDEIRKDSTGRGLDLPAVERLLRAQPGRAQQRFDKSM